MAKNRVTVNMGRTVNLGNYESLRIDESISVDVEAGEKTGDVIDKLNTFLHTKLKADAQAIALKIKQGK